MTTVKVKFSFELFKREVQEIVLYDVPDRFTDGSVKDVGIRVVYIDGTEDVFYAVFSARRPNGARNPQDIEADPSDP